MANLGLSNVSTGVLNVPEQSGATAAAIAAPYTMIAEASGFLGHRLEKALEPQYRAAGAEAVTRDEQGNLQVRSRLEWMDSDRAYNAGANQAFRVQFLDETSRGLRDMRRQFDGRPTEFQSAADAYVRDRIRAVSPELRPFVQAEAIGENRRYVEGAQDQRMQLDKQREVAAFQSRIGLLNSDLDNLAQQGGTQTPEYQQKALELADLRRQMAANPRYAYTPEQMQADERDRQTRDITQTAAGEAYRLYKETGDIARAERLVEQKLMDPTLQLSASDRAKARSEAMGAITSGHAARQAQVAELRQERDLQIQDLLGGREVDPTRVNDLVARLTGLRAVNDVHALRSAQSVNTVVRGMNGASPAEKVRILDDMRRLSGAGGPVPVDAIIGAESNGVATAQNPNSTARGAGQFIASTWLGMVRDHRPDLAAGKSPAEILALRDDPNLSREMTRVYGEQNQGRLRAEGLEPTPGNTYLMHFAGPGGGVALLRNPNAPAAETMAAASGGRLTAEQLITANPFLAGKSGAEVAAWAAQRVNRPGSSGDFSAGAGGSTIYAAALREAQTRVDADAKKAVEDYQKAVTANQTPTDEEKTTLLQLVSRTSDQATRDKLMGQLGQAEVERVIRTLPPDQAQKLAAALQQRAQRGEAGPVEREIATRAVTAAAAAETQRRADPVQHFMDTQGSTPAGRDIMGPPLPVVDTSSPQALGASIDQRVRTGRAVEAFNGGGLISPLSGQDATAIGQALASAGPQDVGSILEALRTRVPQASLEPMMRQAPIKEAVESMARSNDPAKLSATMQFLDSMQTRLGRTQFEDIVGATARERLDDWQTRGRMEDPVQFADRWSRADDPQVRAAREEYRKDGERLARSDYQPDQVANLVTGRWLTSIRPGTAPSAEMDGGQRGVLMQDWTRIMGEEYARYSGDKDLALKKATERIQQVWGVSDANAGRLMRNRPETVFAPVDGSHAWMGEQVQARIVDELGRQRLPVKPDELGIMGGPPLVRYGIVADRQTEAQIAAYRQNPNGAEPPSYQGYYEHPVTKAVVGFRMTFDRAAVLAGQRARDMTMIGIGQEQALDRRLQADVASGATMANDAAGALGVVTRPTRGGAATP